MRVVVEGVDLAVAGRADLNRRAGVETFAFRLLAGNQVVFCESGHLSLAKFAGLGHYVEAGGSQRRIPVTLILR